MKTRDNGWTVGLLLLAAPWTPAEATVLDSFSEGEFHLESGGQQLARSDISSPLVSTRGVEAYGIGPWSIDLVSGGGVLNCDVEDTGPPPGERGFFRMKLSYTRPGDPWSLRAYDAVVLDFLEVTGMAHLYMEIYPSSPSHELVWVPVTSAGEVSYSVSDMRAEDLDDVRNMTVGIVPVSDTFSFSLNEISAVPEPSVGALLFASAAYLLGSRRRNC